MQSILRFTLAGGALLVMAGAWVPGHSASGTAHVDAHLVTMHIESIRHQPVRVHIKSDSLGIWLHGDTAYRAELTIDTPNDVIVGLAVSHVELWTDNKQPVRVQFTDGATEAEKALRPWGWLLSFRRLNGDFQPEPKLVPAKRALSRRD